MNSQNWTRKTNTWKCHILSLHLDLERRTATILQSIIREERQEMWKGIRNGKRGENEALQTSFSSEVFKTALSSAEGKEKKLEFLSSPGKLQCLQQMGL